MATDHRGFLRRVSFLYSAYQWLPATWQIAMLGAMGTVTTYLGFLAGGLYQAAIGLIVAFGLGSMGIFFVQLIIRNSTTYSKLGVGAMGIANVGADIKVNVVKEFTAITMQISMQNTGARDIWFKIIRSDLSILNTVNQEAGLGEDTHLIPPGYPQLVNLASVEHIKVPKYDPRPGGKSPVSGKIKLEFAYGSNKENLTYLLAYDADIMFGWTVSSPDRSGRQTAQVFVSNAITKNVHGMAHAKP